MERIDPTRIPSEIHDVLGILSINGYEAYLVGGCIRDLVDGRAPKDFDIATSARVEEVAGLFLRTIPTGLKHGTVTVLSGTYAIEVTTFRSEGPYHDHRRPSGVVFHGDLALDLSRRDFTCNAMAWSQDRGLVDLFGGSRDMEARILRTVGDPAERFLEDALRMLRAIRFCCTFGYRPVEPLIAACTRHSGLLSHVSAERIASECTRIFLSPFPEWLRAFDGTGILEAAFARLLPAGTDFHGLAVGDAIASALTRFGPSAEGGYALLLLMEPMRTKSESKPMLPSESYTEGKRRLMEGHRLAARVAGRASAMAWVVVEIRGFLLRNDSGSAADLRRIAAALARTADLKGEEARKMMVEGARLLISIEPETEGSLFSYVDAIFRAEPPVAVDELALTGAQLVAKGHSPGPSLGRLRLRLLDAVLEDPSCNVPNALWALVRGMI